MRIVFVTPYYYPELKFGGPPKRLHSMAKALQGHGHHVSVTTFNSEERDRSDRIEADSVRIDYVPYFGSVPRAIPKLRSALESCIAEADVVHCFGLYNFISPAAAWFASRARKPFLLEPMGMFVPRVRSMLMKQLYNATVTKWMLHRASAIVATSELEASEISAAAPAADVVIRRNGININEFLNVPSGVKMRQTWGIKPGEFLVLYLGRISAKKRLIELAQAFDRANVRNARLVVTGPVSEGTYAVRLQSAIQSLESSNRISVVDPVYGDALEAALSAADLFVLPSENENFGNAAAEAVAANVPVLLTNTCGVAPLIHGRAGYAVPLGVDRLAEGIRLMSQPSFRDEVTARRDEVKRELSWDEPVKQTIALYERLVSESRK